ncbi:MAG: hypothetical protein EOR73_09995 [Mesorhizobium sp.]|nr:MAG: hypothetical protein EOR73_09995 [Mesorhizobium sp.]
MLNAQKNTRSSLGFVDKARSAEEEFRQGLASIRAKVEDISRRRDAVLDAPPSVEVALARVDAWWESFVLRSRNKEPAAADFLKGPRTYYTPPVDELSTLTMHLAPALLDQLKDRVRLQYARVKSITEDDRRTQVEALERELLDAEMAEESIIRAGKASGFFALRRQDADRRAVEAVDEALP